ncbi:MAG: hypothetical protein SFZ23_03530 [Planctomycetota bacterium]|nr:hypothetical protein [Planctomycetota bacterium]
MVTRALITAFALVLLGGLCACGTGSRDVTLRISNRQTGEPVSGAAVRIRSLLRGHPFDVGELLGTTAAEEAAAFTDAEGRVNATLLRDRTAQVWIMPPTAAHASAAALPPAPPLPEVHWLEPDGSTWVVAPRIAPESRADRLIVSVELGRHARRSQPAKPAADQGTDEAVKPATGAQSPASLSGSPR